MTYQTKFRIAGIGAREFTAPDLAGLSAAWARFRDAEGFGGSDILTGGTVTRDGKPFGYLSYNGKVWASKDTAGQTPIFNPFA